MIQGLCLTNQESSGDIFIIFLQVEKIKVTAQRGIHCQNSALILTNRTRKVRKGVDIFDKRILEVHLRQCFRIKPFLQLSFPRSRQSINWYLSAWCTAYQDLTLYVSISFFWREGGGRERERETPPSLHYYFLSFFPSRVFWHVIPHWILFSHKKLEGVV